MGVGKNDGERGHVKTKVVYYSLAMLGVILFIAIQYMKHGHLRWVDLLAAGFAMAVCSILIACGNASRL